MGVNDQTRGSADHVFQFMPTLKGALFDAVT